MQVGHVDAILGQIAVSVLQQVETGILPTCVQCILENIVARKILLVGISTYVKNEIQ